MPDSILDVLDDVQGRRRSAPRIQTVPPTRTDGVADVFRGQRISRQQVEDLSAQLQLDYDTTRQGVIERGGQVDDGQAMGWAVVNGQRVPVEDDDSILSVLDEVQGQDGRSLFARAFDAVFTPPQLVTDAAAWLAKRIDDPALREQPQTVLKEGIPLQVPANPMPRAFIAGATEGVGSLLTPGDVALTALGYGPVARVVRGVRGGTQAASALQRGANVATAGRGLERVVDAESVPDAAAGVAQMALGAAGTMARPQARPTPRGALPPGARFVVTPDGRSVPVGTDMPMVQAPDGSFVRAVPGEYARHEIAGYLPPGHDPIVTPPPQGSVPDTSDPSFVRAVPAEYARREVRGELPPGPRFRVTPDGRAISVEQADILAALDDVQGRPPSQSYARGQRAAVLEREIDPTQPTAQAVRVRQYAGDVDAPDAPLVGVEERRMLELMRADLQEFSAQRGRLVRDPRDENAGVFARGGPGSPVGDDVRTIAGNRPDNASIVRAIDDLLDGKPVTNKTQIAALDAARGYIEGRAGYRGPQLPMEAGDEGGLDALAQRLQQEGAEPVGAGARGAEGGTSATVDDFDAFSRMFDDITPDALGRESGEAGFVTAQAAAHVGGGLAGAAIGAESGEDTEDRIKRAMLYGAAGAAAPALLRGRGGVAAAGRAVSRPAGASVSPLEATPPRTGRSGDPISEPMRGMAPFLDKFKNPLVRDGVERLIVENNGYAQQRRGTIPLSTLARFSHEVRVNVSKALPKGTALNAESVTAYGRAMVETQQKVNELAALVNAGRATDADLLALQAARAEADVVARSLVGARAEAGRALAAFNFYRGVLDTGDVNLIRDTLKAPGLREDAERLARGLAEQGNDPLARYRWLQKQGASSLMDKARSYYYANILSGVKTHERNILGNVANIVTNVATHPFAVGVDALKSSVRGTPRQVRLDELPAQAVGAVAGLERGIRDFAFTMRHGVSPDALSRSLHAGELGKLDVPRVEFKGGGLNPFNIPGRLLDAADTLFRSLSRNMELYGLAHTQAKTEGLRGQGFLERVAELRGGVTPESVAIRQQADTFATRTVFQERPGQIAQLLQVAAQKFPPLSFVVPFIKTPANIMRQGLEFSPAGFLMQAARQQGRAGTQAQARVAAGTAAAGALAYYAATGRLSGDGPRDREQRAALMESGWRPNSVRIGDQWVSYQLFQPVSVQAAVIANAFEAWQDQGAKPKAAADVIASTLAKSGRSFLDQSFLQGLADLVEALEEPDRFAPRYAGRFASSMVPLSGAVRTVQQATDPVVRSPKGAAETFQSGLPGYSEQVQARIDRFGEVVTREGGATRRAADPFNVSSVTHDPVAGELARLGVEVSLPSGSLDGFELTRQQQQVLQQARGRAVRRSLERLMRDRRFTSAPDSARVAAVERVISETRRRVTERAKRELMPARASGRRP